MRLIKAENVQVKNWSGGTTKELYIYPKESEYINREFSYRISTATVDVEESTFTALPEYNRLLMILEGEMYIEHEGHHKLKMKPYDIDVFHGSWNTTSKGKVVDFNLMTNSTCSGELKYHTNITNIVIKAMKNEHRVLYVYKGSVKASEECLEGSVFVLKEDEILELTLTNESIIIESIITF